MNNDRAPEVGIETQTGKVFRPCNQKILCRLVYQNTWNAERGQWERRLVHLEELEPCPYPAWNGCK